MRSAHASETFWYSRQLLHPASASVGPDSEKSALRNSPYLSKEALILTIAMAILAPAMLILAFSIEKIRVIRMSKGESNPARIRKTQCTEPQELDVEVLLGPRR